VIPTPEPQEQKPLGDPIPIPKGPSPGGLPDDLIPGMGGIGDGLPGGLGLPPTGAEAPVEPPAAPGGDALPNPLFEGGFQGGFPALPEAPGTGPPTLPGDAPGTPEEPMPDFGEPDDIPVLEPPIGATMSGEEMDLPPSLAELPKLPTMRSLPARPSIRPNPSESSEGVSEPVTTPRELTLEQSPRDLLVAADTTPPASVPPAPQLLEADTTNPTPLIGNPLGAPSLVTQSPGFARDESAITEPELTPVRSSSTDAVDANAGPAALPIAGSNMALALPLLAESKAEASQTETPKPTSEPTAAPLQANWTEALHPGFRRNVTSTRVTYREPAPDPAPLPPADSQISSKPAARKALVQTTATEPISEKPSASPPRQAVSPALDGFCPVELLLNERWVRGDQRWAASYRGSIYYFAAKKQLEQFRNNPVRFTPAASGVDLVQAIDGRRSVPGKTNFCVTYQGRLYMFANAQSLEAFHKNPGRYAIID